MNSTLNVLNLFSMLNTLNMLTVFNQFHMFNVITVTNSFIDELRLWAGEFKGGPCSVCCIWGFSEIEGTLRSL